MPADDSSPDEVPDRWAHLDQHDLEARHYNLETFYMGYSRDANRAFRARALRLGDDVDPLRMPWIDEGTFDSTSFGAGKYVALVFGSASAGPCLDAIGELEGLHRSLAGTNGAIVFVYTREAHPDEPVGPGGARFPAHRSFEQKVEHARRFRDALGLTMPICVDDLVGTVDRTFGGLPWFTVMLDPQHRLFQRADWVDPELLRATFANVRHAEHWDAEGRPASRRRALYCETFWLRDRTQGLFS